MLPEMTSGVAAAAFTLAMPRKESHHCYRSHTEGR